MHSPLPIAQGRAGRGGASANNAQPTPYSTAGFHREEGGGVAL